MPLGSQKAKESFVSQSVPSNVDEVLAITDPGEVDRAIHSRIDRFVVHVSNVFAWSFLILMIAIVAQVFLRGAGHNQAWLDDLQWWVYGASMLAALGYAITTNSHVRVDIIHQNFSDQKKARIETFALGWMLMPFLVVMMDMMIPYAIQSIQSGEGSASPNGLHRVYFLKMLIPVLFLVALLAAWASFRRNIAISGRDLWHRRLIWMFPTAVLLLWRVVHNVIAWSLALTTDTKLSRVPREYETLFAPLLTIAFVVVLLAILITWAMARKTAGQEDI